MSPTAAPCGRRDCPVPHRPPPRSLRTVVWAAGKRLRRGHLRRFPDPTQLVPGTGDTRFAPLVPAGSSRPVHHVYLAETTFAALLESAFHEAAPPQPRVQAAKLARWMESEVILSVDLRLVDLRDAELDRLGIPRGALVATDAVHYQCTRGWAAQLHGRSIGGQPTQGLVWHSRQLELHARALADRPALRDLVSHHPAEVAAVWSPPASTHLLTPGSDGLGPLETGAGRRYVSDLTAELGIVTL